MEIQEINNIQEYIDKVLKKTGEEWDNRVSVTASYTMSGIIGTLNASLNIIKTDLEALKRNL